MGNPATDGHVLASQTDGTRSWVAKQDELGFTPENSANKGANNGYASLDSGGKVPASQLPSSVMHYLGVWDAENNTPEIGDDGESHVNGDIYLVSTAGTIDLGSGPITFAVGDWVIYNGAIWEKSINSNAVVSVNGETGVAILDADNIDDSETDNKFVTAGEKETWDGKQDELTAGDNINITAENVISATNTTYTDEDFDISDLSDEEGKREEWDGKQDALISFEEETNNFTLEASMNNKMIHVNKSEGDVTVTVPRNETVSIPVGTTIVLRQANTGKAIAVPGHGDVTLLSPEAVDPDGLQTTKKEALMSLVKIDTDTWVVSGLIEEYEAPE